MGIRSSDAGSVVTLNNMNITAKRIGLKLSGRYFFEDGKELEPFVEANLVSEWSGVTPVNYAGSTFKSDISGHGYELSLGVNGKFSNNLSYYSDVTYENGKVVEALSANLGIRYNF